MESPRLSGFRKGTRGYEVTADAALQDVRKPSLIELERMHGHIATDEQGGVARLSAASGLFDTARESLDLKTDIRISTDKGEEARLQSAAVTFKTGSVDLERAGYRSRPRAAPSSPMGSTWSRTASGSRSSATCTSSSPATRRTRRLCAS